MPKVLTPLQDQVLRLLFERGAGDWGYFLTGGTALGEYYLQHRRSDDLDLFNRTEKDLATDAAEFEAVLEAHGLTVSSERAESYVRFHVGDEKLKVELARDVKAQMAPVNHFAGIHVDSLEDIAVNKVCALSRQEPKDYVDLYFILTEGGWTLEYLLERARLKDRMFDDPRGHLQFAYCLSLVGSFTLPAFMLKPLDTAAMQARLTAEAEKIMRRFAPGS